MVQSESKEKENITKKNQKRGFRLIKTVNLQLFDELTKVFVSTFVKCLIVNRWYHLFGVVIGLNNSADHWWCLNYCIIRRIHAEIGAIITVNIQKLSILKKTVKFSIFFFSFRFFFGFRIFFFSFRLFFSFQWNWQSFLFKKFENVNIFLSKNVTLSRWTE